MNFNKKLVNGLIALFAVVWIGNFIIYKQNVLKEPLFIKHFYDIKAGMEGFNLHYIENINSDQRIINITFPELGEEYVNFDQYESNRDNRYYRMKTINISIYRGELNKLPEKYKNKLISKAEITFYGGKKIAADIGKIYLYSDDFKESDFQSKYSSVSSDHTGKASLEAKKDIKITGLNSRFPDLLNEILNIKINNQNFSEVKFPIEMTKGSTVDMSHGFVFNKGDIRRNYAYIIPVEVITEDFNGTKGRGNFYINYFLQSPEQYDIKELVKKERGN